ncbi:glycoside hydrolase family 78 protein [Candidatus Latescibacterota bacterium]
MHRLQSLTHRMFMLLIAAVILSGIHGCGPKTTDITVHSLTCEYLQDPIGIDILSPRLSWKMESQQRGQTQTAYQILVSSSEGRLTPEEQDIWDSGKVLSDRSVHIPVGTEISYTGSKCYWKVRVWDKNDIPSEYSVPAYWEMGILRETDWYAKWISAPETKNRRTSRTSDDRIDSWSDAAGSKGGENLVEPAPMFRKTFPLYNVPISSRAYISGLGYYELYINGVKIGDHVLDPALTPYDHRVLYATYDISDYLIEGTNSIGIILGNGFYNMSIPAWGGFQNIEWRNRPTVKCQIDVRMNEGSRKTVVTDESWKVTDGPIRFDGVLNGETYDARREIPGWDTTEFDDSDWADAVVVPGPAGKLTAQMIPPVKVMQSITPVSVTEPKPGRFVFDMGQNMAGKAQLTVSGPAGTKVVMGYGERLYDDGTLDTEESERGVQGRFQTDEYILKGDGVEVWEARFAYHGFQYVEVTGYPGTPSTETLTAHVIHTSFENAGTFECSNELFNKIHECTRWSYISNFMGNPTDCPQREKNGWTGDGHIAGETGLLNFANAAGYNKWIDDFTGEQREDGEVPAQIPNGGGGYRIWDDYPYPEAGFGPAWNSTYIIVPWYLYLYRGDTKILADHYDEMTRWYAYIESWSPDYICNIGLGDWVSLEQDTPVEITSTGYYYIDAVLLSKIAALLGKDGDSTKYAEHAERIKDAFNAKFYHPESGLYGEGTQTAMSAALYQGLVEPGEIDTVVENLVKNIENGNGHLNVGLLGSKYLLNVLTDHGRGDVAYEIASKTDYPSYGYWIVLGATTLWEDWPGERSRNHIMFGEIDAWFYKSLAGINPEPVNPGFKNIIIRPLPLGDLTWVKAEHNSGYGPIKSSWRRENGTFTLDVTIPPNTTAEVYIPTDSANDITESGKPAEKAEGVTFRGIENGAAVFETGSGTYHFVSGAAE